MACAVQVYISSADAQNERPGPLPIDFQTNFFNTQGRKYLINYLPVAPASFYVTADLWIPLLWNTTSPTSASLNRRADLWTQISDPANPKPVSDLPFPIISFVRARLPCCSKSYIPV